MGTSPHPGFSQLLGEILLDFFLTLSLFIAIFNLSGVPFNLHTVRLMLQSLDLFLTELLK